MLDVLVSIVNHRHVDLLPRCIDSALASRGVAVRPVVLDNHSPDGSADMVRQRYPDVELIAQQHADGFSANNNAVVGPRLDQARYFLLLNDDAALEPDALRRIVEYMDTHPRVGIAGARLLYPDGSPQSSYAGFPTGWDEVFYLWGFGKLVPKTVRRPLATLIRPFARFLPKLGRVYLENWFHTPDTPIEVDWVCGAALMARRETVQQIGLLDAEAFFMYYEDVDWCRRARSAGWAVGFVPGAVVRHEQQASRSPVTQRAWVESGVPVLHETRDAVRRLAAARERRREGRPVDRLGRVDMALPWCGSPTRQAPADRSTSPAPIPPYARCPHCVVEGGNPVRPPRAVICTICRTDDGVPLYRPRLSPGPVVRCRRCGLVYVSPVEQVERLADETASGATEQLIDAAETPEYRALYLAEAAVKEQLYAGILVQLESLLGRPGDLLDIGSYMGLFLQAARSRGWRGRGIEPDRDAWMHATATLGLDVCWGTLATCPQPASALDAITMLQVLEHVPDPRQTLVEVRTLLRPGGVLVVEVPNIDCWPVRLLGRRHRHFAKHHFTFFGLATLSRLLKESGFEVQSVSYPSRQISLRLFSWGLKSWHPGLQRIVAPVLSSKPLQNRVLRLRLGEVLSVCARRTAASA